MREPSREDDTPFRRAVRATRRGALSAFIAFHLASVAWWNIPQNGYGDDRREPLPRALERTEDAICAWKRRVQNTPVVPPAADPVLRWEREATLALENWTIFSATWQNWWMFAPNPVNVHRYLTVKAVTSYGKNKEPVYDPKPLWTSYRGTIAEELVRFGGSYTHEHKFVENLTGEWDPHVFMGQFSRFWCEQWTAAHHGHPPLEIHVICDEYRLPEAFAGVSASSVEAREWVYWWFKP
jgi:hypothetical protein